MEGVRPPEDLSEGPRTGERDTDGAQQAGIKQANGKKGPDITVSLHQFLSGLRSAVDVDAREHGPGHDDDEYGHNHGNARAEQSVEATPRDVFLEHPLVDHGTLLEKQHPGGDRRSDVGHEKEEKLAVESPGEVRNQTLAQHVSNGRVHDKRSWDVDQVQCAE